MPVDLNFFRSQTSQRIRAEGFRRGIALSVLQVLNTRDVPVSGEARQRVLGCGDQELLILWLDRALTVSDQTELFEG
jgi:hypothetical protein